MNNFKRKKISKHPPLKPLSEKTKQNLTTALGIILLILVLYYGGMHLVGRLSNIRFFSFFSTIVGKSLETDYQNHTNILALGVGGEGHEGKDLTDTIIVASLNHTDHTIGLISIPRDLHVNSDLGENRINRLYELGKIKWGSEEALDFVQDTVSDILQIPIHYNLKIDFEAFEKAVDAIGGVDIYVEQAINDTEYPKDGTYDFEPFYLKSGLQHLNGKTALKYVRSRKTTSDFDRSKRQQQVLMALKQKAHDEGLFSSKRLLKQMYYSLTDHIETNMSIREMVSLADFAAKFKSEDFASATLNDEPIFRGGFLYPPLRELYGGAYVLLPAGDNFDSIKLFAQLVLYGPKDISDFPLAILNGTKTAGLAASAKSILNRFGFKIGRISNAREQNVQNTTWYILDENARPTVDSLQNIFSGEVNKEIPEEYVQDPGFSNVKIILELGADALFVINKFDVFQNIFELKPSTPAAGTSTDET